MPFHAERSGGPQRYLAQEFINTGVYVSHAPGAVFSTSIVRHDYDPRARYKIRILAGINKFPPESRKFLSVIADDIMVQPIKVSGTPRNPKMIEFDHAPTFGKKYFQFRFREKRNMMVDGKAHKMKVDRYGDWCSIWVDRMEIEGPFYDGLTYFEALLFPDGPPQQGEKIERTDEQARGIIAAFATEACRRRQPDSEFLDKLYALYQESRAAGQDVETALVDPLAAILCSPAFLYLTEESKADSGKTELTDRGLAVRLAYFLWSSPPDEQLYLLAQHGTLKRPAVLTAQVDRMLRDPRSHNFSDAFMSQWMQLSRFDAIAVDSDQYLEFDKPLAWSARREPVELFQTLLDENLSLTNFVDSEFVVIDKVLAHHYGIEGVEGQGFHKVQLPPNSKRGGLLGTTAFLTMGSTGDRTSPIIQGVLVLEQLLNDKPASPPPNVPQLSEASANPVSVRDAIKLHQKKPQCASCHSKIDPIGFGLENFDVIGQWRDTEKVGNKDVVIPMTGMLADGTPYTGLDDLKKQLLNQKDQLTESLVRGVIAYGLGREVEFSDGRDVNELVQRVRQENYSTRSLIHGFVQSQLFRTK